MSSSFDQTFITVWETEIYQALRAYGGQLPQRCSVGSLKGATVTWPKLGAFTVRKNPSRNAPLTPSNATHSSVSATLDNYDTMELIDDLDEFKNNSDYRAGYNEGIVGDLASQADLDIVTELEAGSTNFASGTAQTVDKTLFATLRSTIAEKGNWRFNGENMVTYAISPTAAAKVRSVAEILSKDFQDKAGMSTTGLPKVYGIDIFVVPEMETLLNTAVDHNSYLWNKPGVGFRWGKKISTTDERRPDLNAQQVLGTFSAKVKTIDVNASFRVKLDTA